MRAAETAAEASAPAGAGTVSLPDERLSPFPAQKLLDSMAGGIQVRFTAIYQDRTTVL